MELPKHVIGSNGYLIIDIPQMVFQNYSQRVSFTIVGASDRNMAIRSTMGGLPV